MDGELLMWTKCVKFLGILIDDKLTWKNHIEYISSKFAKVIGIVLKVRDFLPRRTLISLYYVFGYPYLTYCDIVWGSTYTTNLSRLVSLQKKLMRIICYAHPRTHTSPIFQNFNILPFLKVNDYLIANFMFKYKMGILPDIFDDLFTENTSIHSHNTRLSNDYHIYCFRLKFTQFCLRYKGPKIWNNVPEKMKKIQNFNLFKNKNKLSLLNLGN